MEELLEQPPVSPKYKLWKSLNEASYYTKPYEDFSKQFSTPQQINKLHGALSEAQFYTKSTADFNKQFFPPEKKNPTENIGQNTVGLFQNGGAAFLNSQGPTDLSPVLPQARNEVRNRQIQDEFNAKPQLPTFNQDDTGVPGANAPFREKYAYSLNQAQKKADAAAKSKQESSINRDWSNTVPMFTHAVTRMAADAGSGTANLLRDIIGKLDPKTTAAKNLYNKPAVGVTEYGNDGLVEFKDNEQLTPFGKRVDEGKEKDPLGRLILGLDAYTEAANQDDAKNQLPNTLLGNTAGALINIAPDLAATALFPEGKASTWIGGALKNPFTKLLATKGALSGYSAAKKEGGRYYSRNERKSCRRT